jgi:uncharacterized protein YegP (UPF0339 family)
MATATKKAHAAPSPAHAVPRVSESASLVFGTYRDNGDHYHWEIVGRGGAILAQSHGFASEVDAERAARAVHQAARTASFESQMANERHTVVG